jgi:hypothetical protein
VPSVLPPLTSALQDRGVAETPVNKPLSFQLQGVDAEHAYLQSRGITPETARTFGIGFFSGRGSMSGRVVIPIHNERGELVAYAGRATDDNEPRYKLPVGFLSTVIFGDNCRSSAGRPWTGDGDLPYFSSRAQASTS